MEVILLGIYSFFVWLIFFKFKWLPWNITSQVIVITLPIIGLTVLILLLNLVSFGFIVFHTITFFNAAPQAIPVYLGRTRVPNSVVGAAHYAALIGASVIVAWILLSA